MDLGLAERVYIITGGSRGLGFATAEALVADGARVIISSRNPGQVNAAAHALGDQAIGVPADLATPTTPELLLSSAKEHFSRVDGVLISGGGPPAGTALSLDDTAWQAAFETVFLGPLRMAKATAQILGPGGVIGFVLSASVREPITGLGLSNGLRPGLAGAAKDMAQELGPRGVRVISLLPYRIMTDRARELLTASGDPERAAAQVTTNIPLGRMGEPAEFGRVAAFLLSPAASYLTGITVAVDGGALHSI